MRRSQTVPPGDSSLLFSAPTPLAKPRKTSAARLHRLLHLVYSKGSGTPVEIIISAPYLGYRLRNKKLFSDPLRSTVLGRIQVRL